MSHSSDARPSVRSCTTPLFLLLAIVVLSSWVARTWFAPGVPRAVTPRGELASFETTTIAVFESASPSVVYISTRTRVANRWTRRATEVESGTGSGFVWDTSGHVVTNYHVIEGATAARVVFGDQAAYDATLVGASPQHDLAVLKILAPARRLEPVSIGESHDLRVGQAVFAIGNPFGLQQTLTTGVVSSSSRRILGPAGRPIEDVIQIDAAINPGNSGGPLLDSAGRLIGVNTAIYSPSGASAGVGFAVPVDTANRVVPQIIAQGRYEPPRMGVHVNDALSRRVTARQKIAGVLLLEVLAGGGAEEAGLRGTTLGSRGITELGDIVLKVDERPISSFVDLLSCLDGYSRGDRVQVTFLRDGTERTVEVELR